MCTALLNRTGASIDFSIARQFEPTGLFDLQRRSARRAVAGQMSLF
jgi:hypothetical protein